MIRSILATIVFFALCLNAHAVVGNFIGSVRVENLPVPADPPFYVDVTMYITDHQAAPIQVASGRVRVTGDGNFNVSWYEINVPYGYDWYITASGDGFNDGVWARLFDPSQPGSVEIYHTKRFSPARPPSRRTYLRVVLPQWILSE